MINFRYHIVSLMAVFIALSVGIAVGVSLSPSVDEGILAQAQQDRKQVTDLRTEIDRLNRLDAYRETYEKAVGTEVTAGQLAGVRVALVTMPDAPAAVVQAVSTAVEGAGGSVLTEVEVSDEVFDTTRTDQVNESLTKLSGLIGFEDDATVPTKVGLALGRALAAKQSGTRDSTAKDIGAALASDGLVNVRADVNDTAQLVIVVSAPTTTPVTSSDLVASHVQLDLALKQQDGASVVVAGPNSDGLDGTDVLGVRTTSEAESVLSTVDVADLASGVTTVVLAGREQQLGRSGHYGAGARTDAALPDLPVR